MSTYLDVARTHRPFGRQATQDKEWARWLERALTVARPPELPPVPVRVRIWSKNALARAVLFSWMAAVAVVAAGAVALGAGQVAAGDGGGEAIVGSVLRVRPGDSLWAVAVRFYPDVDPRIAVERIVASNRLRDDQLRVGQWLELPR